MSGLTLTLTRPKISSFRIKKETEESVWGLSVKAAGAWISSTRVARTQGETSVP